MAKTKVVVTLDSELLSEIDELVRVQQFANRSQAIEAAVQEQLLRLRRTRLADACALLDPVEERAIAEEGFALSETPNRVGSQSSTMPGRW